MDIRSTEAFQKSPQSVRRGAQTLLRTLREALDTKRGCLIGRNGSTELAHCLFPSRLNRDHMLRAGIWPLEKESLDAWRNETRAAMEAADVMAAGWYAPLAGAELALLDKVAPEQEQIPLRSLEPYYVEPEFAWTHVLAGRRVCVVSAFADTMRKQIQRAESIWPARAESLLPISAQWHFVRSYFCPEVAGDNAMCQWPHATSWDQAVEHMEREVLQTLPDVVLIGCGGLGMPLAHRLKQRGVACVVMGGAIQTLFGIKGERWRTHPVIGAFWNDVWVAPSAEETPGTAALIEGGCYWSHS